MAYELSSSIFFSSVFTSDSLKLVNRLTVNVLIFFSELAAAYECQQSTE
jgi:hypothetical protein